MNGLNIIVDSREKNVERLEELEKLVDYKVKKIPGDADVLVNAMLIEITTTEDFAGKLNSNRIHVQVKKMEDAKKRLKEENNIDVTLCWLLEGTKWSYKDKRTGKTVRISKNRVFSALTDLSVDSGFTIIRKANPKKTAEYLARLAKRGKDVTGIYQSLRDKKGIGKKSLDEQAKFVLEGFINSGNKTAHDLLVECGTLRKALNVIINSGEWMIAMEEFSGAVSTVWKGALKDKNDLLLDHVYKG